MYTCVQNTYMCAHICAQVPMNVVTLYSIRNAVLMTPLVRSEEVICRKYIATVIEQEMPVSVRFTQL